MPHISASRAPGATLDRQPPASGRHADPAAPAQSGVDRGSGLVHVVACLIFIGCALLLFRLSLFQGWTYIGDSDRLNNILNLRLFEVVSIEKWGRVSTWNENEFLGYGVVGVHWMLPGAPPVAQIMASLPPSAFYHAFAMLAAGLLALAMAAAYWGLGAYSSGPVQRLVGALLYATGAYTVHKLTQLDLSFAALVAPPVLLRLVYTTRRETAAWTFLGMAACWAALVTFTVLQEIAYIGFFWGLYALYRTIRLRDPWPVVATGLAFVGGVVIGAPRVLTVAAEIPVVARTSNNMQTTAVEALRYFGDGLLGRTQSEQGMLRGSAINMHEGVQLLGSALAALAAIALGMLAPSRWLRFWGVALLVVLSVALNAYFRSFYELEGLGLRGVAYPSRELRTVAINAVLIGLPVWIAAWWLTRGARSASGRPSPLSRPRSDFQVGPATAAQDLPFFFGFVVLGLAVILIPEARAAFYYGFMKMDFQHSRISVAMTLPLAAIAVMFLNRFLPARITISTVRWLAIGVGISLALWLVREVAAEAVVSRVGPSVDALRPRRLFTLEVVRVLGSLLVLLASLVLMARRTHSSWGMMVGGVLASWMALETLAVTDYRLSGPPATEQTRPFSNLDYMQVPPGQMNVPTTAQRAAVRERLEADRYRVILLQDRANFMALVGPHLAAFWDLRLAEGYSTGAPRRLGALPWDDSIFTTHHMDVHAIHPPQDLPWRLMAALNVRYVVRVDRSLWFNPSPGRADAPLDPSRIEILENPNPVTPRVFFAARVSPAGPNPLFPGDDGVRPAPKDPPVEDPVRHSVAEGLDEERLFSTDGVPAATFAGDRVVVRVDPVDEDRFLVLNEMFHPAWQAQVDGVPTTIFPTNLVMRGIVVPAGATTVELQYVPFLHTTAARGILVAGLLLVVLLAWGLWRVDLTPRAPFLTWRR